MSVFQNYLGGRQAAQSEQENQLRNRLAQQGMALDQQRFGLDQANSERQQRALDAQMSAREQEQSRASQDDNLRWAQNAYNFAKRAPQQIPNVIRAAKQRQMLPADFSEEVTPEDLDAFAVQWGLVSPDQAMAGGRSPFGNVNPGDFEPNSIEAYKRTVDPQTGIGDFSQLRRVWAPPAVSVRDIGGAPSIVDPSRRLGGDTVTPLNTPQSEREAAAEMERARVTAREEATAGANARSDLPRIEGNAMEMNNLLNLLEQSNLGLIFGAASVLPVVPGTPQANAHAVWEQVQGKAFMEAFNTLKGGGQITEKEGEKATAAMTRLANRRQSPESARRAIQELRDLVNGVVQRAQRRAAASGTITRQPEATGGWSVEVVQ